MKQKPILSIALLVSNRKDTIQRCLESLEPIREAIPSELIILDTGCDADLHELLDKYADKIENFTWIIGRACYTFFLRNTKVVSRDKKLNISFKLDDAE